MSEDAAVEDRAVSDAKHRWADQWAVLPGIPAGTHNTLPQQKTAKQQLSMINNSVFGMVNCYRTNYTRWGPVKVKHDTVGHELVTDDKICNLCGVMCNIVKDE